VDRVPVINVFQTATVDQMEACGAFWPEAHVNSTLMAKLALAASKVANLDCVRLPFTAAIEASAFGCRVNWGDRRLFPEVFPLEFPERGLDMVEPSSLERCKAVVEAVEYVKRASENLQPILVGVQSPFTLAGMVVGAARLLKGLEKEPDVIRRVLEAVADFSTSYCRALTKSGADIVAIIEACGTGLMVGTEYFNVFVQPYIEKLAERINVPVILHVAHSPRLIEKPLKELLAEGRIDGFCLEWGFNIPDTRHLIGERTALVGNLDPVKLLSGTTQQVEEHTTKIIRDGVDILSAGCDLQPETPTKNLLTIVEIAEKLGSKKFG